MRDGKRLRAVYADAPASEWINGSLSLEMTTDAEVTWQKKAYRGTLTYAATDTALLIVNRIDVEEYLKGVVPLEIGGRLSGDHAAVEAQAVAARSFTYTKMFREHQSRLRPPRDRGRPGLRRNLCRNVLG